MAVPSKKVSRAKRGMRRAHLRSGSAPLSQCPQCANLRRPHHVCPSCGHYDNEEIVVVPGPDTDEDEGEYTS